MTVKSRVVGTLCVTLSGSQFTVVAHDNWSRTKLVRVGAQSCGPAPAGQVPPCSGNAAHGAGSATVRVSSFNPGCLHATGNAATSVGVATGKLTWVNGGAAGQRAC
jgi:hypothetical protein